ncbi:hypothetical protein [Rhizobium laguerreae]|uniref:hypothetical protein n=1 Tax=Rhizobium laguerreae TaxID=1076926 RepID=UPI0014416EF7|nr:hypothetical protein [Rhizobium laguerreae]NKM30764.1 hypothetical protein [Rhizobium laguerreae]
MDEIEPTDLSYWKLDDPRGVLGQTRAAALMRSDKRASYKHFALIEFHWGWSHKKYDYTSLVSVRKMHSTLAARNPLGEAALSLPHISKGNRDLCDWGWLIELEKGSGRNASRFVPNFAIFHVAAEGNFSSFLNGEITLSVNPVGERNGFGISVHRMGNAGVTYEVNANRFCVHPVGNKDPLTETGLQDRFTERGIEPAPPSAPLPVGLAATGADGAGGGFEDVWKAYDYKQKKAEALAAYKKLAPDEELHARLVEAASIWKASWAAQQKADAPRFTLAKWLDREEFECEPPTAYKAKERKAKAPRKKEIVAANDNEDGDWESGPMICDVGPFTPFGRFKARIVGSRVEHVDSYTEKVVLDLEWNDRGLGPDAQHTFYFQHQDPKVQERGQAFVQRLAECTGIDELTDTEQFHGAHVYCTINNKLAVFYEAAA